MEYTVYTTTISIQNKEDTTASTFAFIVFTGDATCFDPFTGHQGAYKAPAPRSNIVACCSWERVLNVSLEASLDNILK
jgi:hypothetical protein